MRALMSLALITLAIVTIPAYAADDCKYRGDLDTSYCDEDKDLVADPPKNPSLFRNPETIVFSFTPTENPDLLEKMFARFTKYLGQCIDKKVEYLKTYSYTEEIEAMREGKLHVGAFATGQAAFAVNVAGAVPFGVKGDSKRFHGYNLLFIVRKDSPYRKLTALKGKTVAHVTSSSNSGHLAPMALFPTLGLTPGKDYKIEFSGKHDESVFGVLSGKYDGAPVASDVFYRMAAQGRIKEEDFRILYISPAFPTDVLSYVYDLEPTLRDRVVKMYVRLSFRTGVEKSPRRRGSLLSSFL